MKQLLTWVFSALVFAGIGGVGTWFFLEGREPGHESNEHAATQSAPEETPPVSRDESGSVVVRMDEEMQHRVGLEVATLAAAEKSPEISAYGSVQEDPSRSFTVRAPLAGAIVAGDGKPWVRLGQRIEAGAVVGGVAPRLGPVEQADLKARLSTARADEEEARASLEALRLSLESKRKLNTGQKIVSDQVLQEAEAKVKGEEARLKAAGETVRTLEASISTAARASDVISLIAAQGGTVVEVAAQPGESIESGQPVLRLANYDRLIARVALPGGGMVNNIESASVTVVGDHDRLLPAEPIGPAATVDALTGGQTMLLAFSPGDLPVQPGMPITARLKIRGNTARGVLVPRDAVIRYVGAAWVYQKTGEGAFTRRELVEPRAVPEGWFVSTGLSSGDVIVSRAAQCLLSTELKFQTGGGEEEEE